MPAPEGNKNSADGKIWRAAIRSALNKRSKSRHEMKEALDDLAERFLQECDNGNIPAFRELGDRLDGKPALEVTGADGGPLTIEIIRIAD